jgi:hypothetical protein
MPVFPTDIALLKSKIATPATEPWRSKIFPSELAKNDLVSVVFSRNFPPTFHKNAIFADAVDVSMANADSTPTRLNNTNLALNIYAISFASKHRGVRHSAEPLPNRNRSSFLRQRPIASVDALIANPGTAICANGHGSVRSSAVTIDARPDACQPQARAHRRPRRRHRSDLAHPARRRR